MRPTPSRISPATYPIAATATAPAYDFEPEPAPVAATSLAGQQVLFSAPVMDDRVIPFDTLTSPAEREAIRLRAAETQRPAPVRSARVESRRARSKRDRDRENQRNLEFSGSDHLAPIAPSVMLCEAPVATAGLRVEAAVFDALLIGCGFGPGLALFFYVGGRFSADKHVLAFVAAALLTVPLLYKLIWAFAGRDTPGTRIAGLELVDFDGRKPTRRRRFGRLFGSVLSFLAAGMGLIWSLVDEDKLTWHDHMSGTFPTFAADAQQSF